MQTVEYETPKTRRGLPWWLPLMGAAGFALGFANVAVVEAWFKSVPLNLQFLAPLLVVAMGAGVAWMFPFGMGIWVGHKYFRRDVRSAAGMSVFVAAASHAVFLEIVGGLFLPESGAANLVFAMVFGLALPLFIGWALTRRAPTL